MKKIDIITLRSIQLNILKVTAEYCEKENLRYFLAYGTLLGAIRHNGYIPWDDDIDIVMPRPDYMKFISLFNQQDQYIKVYACENNKKMMAAYAKVCDERTIFDSALKYLPPDLGVFIDIFPIDGLPLDFYECYNHNLRIAGLFKKFYISAIPFNPFIRDTNLRRFLGGLFRLFQRICSMQYKKNMILLYNNEIVRLLRKYDYEQCPIVATHGAYYLKEIVVKDEIFSDFKLCDFEGTKFRIPIGYDKLLSQIYGDYMQLPPKKQRKPHHYFRALYWKNGK
jgi:lipopolysaccharide cholinephosphotransferase